MHYSLRTDYKPRLKLINPYDFSDPLNYGYLISYASRLFERVKNSAKPYHLKNTGTPNRGARGKLVSITKEDIYNKLVEQNGICAGTGEKMYFGDLNHMFECVKGAKEFKLLNDYDNWSKASVDRIDSDGDYTIDNIQLTTIRYNLSMGSCKKLKQQTDSSNVKTTLTVENDLRSFVIVSGNTTITTSLPLNADSASFLAQCAKFMNT